jgi:hypothetical protein
MSGTNASRYLPTLTEVVSPDTVLQVGEQPVAPQVPWNLAPHSTVSSAETAAITQDVIGKITPLLEAQMRSIVMPALQKHIEAALREAIHKVLAERGISD